MTFNECENQLNSLIEHFNNGGRDFNATDILAIKVLLIQNKILEEQLKNNEASFIEFLNNKELIFKQKVQYFEKILRNTDKKSFYYQSYLKNIHKLNSKREFIKELLRKVSELE